MKIALASPPYPASIADGLEWVEKLIKEAALQQAEIICFPESYIPGYPGMGADPAERTSQQLEAALRAVRRIAASNSIAVIIPMDWYREDILLNLAFVIDGKGEVLGYQTKNQLDPSEDNLWQAGTERKLFEVNGVKFGITICHEGYRYPESVRWAARNGAQVVFHPNYTGSNDGGRLPTEWGAKENPYYEKAQMLRAMENTIYFATSNYAFQYPESASSLIGPDGSCIAYQAYGKVGVITATMEPEKATGLLAGRFKPELYPDPVGKK
jgi:predicted amidohydrolase